MASKKGKKATALSEETVVENGTAGHAIGLTNGGATKTEADQKVPAKGRGRPKKAEAETKVDSTTNVTDESTKKSSAPRQSGKSKTPPVNDEVIEGTEDVSAEDSPPQSKKGKGRGRPAKEDKPEKKETNVKADKPGKTNKPAKVDILDKEDKPEKADETEKVDKAVKTNKNVKVEKKLKTVPETEAPDVATTNGTKASAKARGRPKKNV